MRKWLTEDALREIADTISETIVIRTYITGCSCDTRRPATAQEKECLYKVIYSALLTLNDGCENRGNPVADRAIVDTAEFMIRLLIPDCNGYDSVYIPLNDAIADWAKGEAAVC